MKNPNEHINLVCFDCGSKFLTEKDKKESRIVTAQIKECGLCKQIKSVTSARHYNYLKPLENEN